MSTSPPGADIQYLPESAPTEPNRTRFSIVPGHRARLDMMQFLRQAFHFPLRDTESPACPWRLSS